MLSGNRNFEGRINPSTRANYLSSPLLCIAYAIAGTVSIDFEIEPLGKVDGHLFTIFCGCFVWNENHEIEPCLHSTIDGTGVACTNWSQLQ